jgi:hypothetical protein
MIYLIYYLKGTIKSLNSETMNKIAWAVSLRYYII